MAIPTKKKASVILKDSNGSLFQALPETRADCVSYENSNAADEMARQADYDVAEASTEIETQTETEIQHLQPNGTISISNDELGNTYPLRFIAAFVNTHSFDQEYQYYVDNFHISFTEPHVTNLLQDFRDENGTVLMNLPDCYNSQTSEVHIPANQQYYFNFTLDNDLNFVPNAICIYMEGCNFAEEGSDEVVKNIIAVAGDDYISNSDYTGVGEIPYEPLIQFALPSVGESATFCFNAYADYDIASNAMPYWQPIEHFDKFITIENIDGTNYRFVFHWNTARDVETTETTKLFKTTITREDDTETVARTVVSGLLQSIDASYSETLESVVNDPTANRYIYTFAIGDQDGTEREDI